MSNEYVDGEGEDVTLAKASFNVLVLATIGTGVLLVLGLMTLLLLRCYNCWKWSQYHRQKDEEAGLNGKTTIQISHSLPDLTQDMEKKEYFVQNVKETATTKKVLRQSTLPAVPTRLETFQRQLSHRLESLTMPATPKRMKIDPIVQTLEKSRRRGNEDSIGLIQPELYKNELTRQPSTDESTCNEHVGQLQYSLKYDQELETLIVKVLQALELSAKDMNGNSDPYIKIYLLPDRKKKCQTKVHRRNLNPFFNEMFLFNIPYEELKERSLQFSVYDFERFSRHDLIGHVIMKNILDSDLSCEMHYTMDILSPPKDKLYLGELLLSLCYLPTAGRLTVTIIKARNLRAMDITGSSDPYTKVYLMCQGKKIRKRKTSIQKASLAPIWNESLVFDVPSQNIADVQLLFKVMDYDRVGPNEQLGCAVATKDHWAAMLDNPRRPVAQWYELVDSVVPSALPLSTLDGTSPPDSPFVKKTHKGRHLSFGCFEGTKTKTHNHK